MKTNPALNTNFPILNNALSSVGDTQLKRQKNSTIFIPSWVFLQFQELIIFF